MRFAKPLLTLLMIALPTVAMAHPGHGATGALAGFTHPMSGIDHILAMVAVGVFAFVLGGRALILVPLSFVGMMTVGFLLGVSGVQLPFVELAIGLSSVVIGGAAASGRSMPVGAAMALVGAFAVFHGHAHGAEMPQTEGGLDFALGFIAATALLHVAGIAGAAAAARVLGRYGKTAAQVAGAMFAVGGVGVLAGWL